MEILGSAIWKLGGGELGAINEAEAVWDMHISNLQPKLPIGP